MNRRARLYEFPGGVLEVWNYRDEDTADEPRGNLELLTPAEADCDIATDQGEHGTGEE